MTPRLKYRQICGKSTQLGQWCHGYLCSINHQRAVKLLQFVQLGETWLARVFVACV